MKQTIIIGILLFFAGPVSNFAQEIYLSNEINFNSDDGFFLMGTVHDTVLLFHENGNKYNIDVHKGNLEYLFSKELSFEKDKIHFNAIIARENDYSIIYSYEDRFNLKVKARKYDVRGNIIDSVGIFEERDYLDIEHFSVVLSEDENKLALFRSAKYDRLEFLLFDLETHEKIWFNKMLFQDYNIPSDMNGLLLTNQGKLILAFEKYNFTFNRKKHFQHLYIIDPYTEETSEVKINFEGMLSSSFNFVSDEKNQEIVVAGLFSPKSSSRSYGYYMYKLHDNGISQKINFVPFRNQLLLNYAGKRRNPKKYISDLKLQDIALRNDGGMVLITEMQKEILRESVRRRYVDYHFEDVILLSIHPEGDLFWDQLIRKYQLSYDDRARFSSYFLFKNPSTMRIVFNDEIKSENTISEYIFNPLGEGKRNSLFSTDLHRLKLVFEDAVQLTPKTFIVPSVYNSKYRIIMIKY